MFCILPNITCLWNLIYHRGWWKSKIHRKNSSNNNNKNFPFDLILANALVLHSVFLFPILISLARCAQYSARCVCWLGFGFVFISTFENFVIRWKKFSGQISFGCTFIAWYFSCLLAVYSIVEYVERIQNWYFPFTRTHTHTRIFTWNSLFFSSSFFASRDGCWYSIEIQYQKVNRTARTEKPEANTHTHTK